MQEFFTRPDAVEVFVLHIGEVVLLARAQTQVIEVDVFDVLIVGEQHPEPGFTGNGFNIAEACEYVVLLPFFYKDIVARGDGINHAVVTRADDHLAGFDVCVQATHQLVITRDIGFGDAIAAVNNHGGGRKHLRGVIGFNEDIVTTGNGSDVAIVACTDNHAARFNAGARSFKLFVI